MFGLFLCHEIKLRSNLISSLNKNKEIIRNRKGWNMQMSLQCTLWRHHYYTSIVNECTEVTVSQNSYRWHKFNAMHVHQVLLSLTEGNINSDSVLNWYFHYSTSMLTLTLADTVSVKAIVINTFFLKLVSWGRSLVQTHHVVMNLLLIIMFVFSQLLGL